MGKRGPRPGQPPKHNLLGRTFGKLVVLSYAGRSRYHKPLWHCRCECGGEKNIDGRYLLIGVTRSCGRCVSRMVGDRWREYRKWQSMIERCRVTAHCQRNYQARGIAVCKEWLNDFEAFYRHIGPCPPGMTLDRIDNDRGYEPGNVRWIPAPLQARNRRNNRRITFRGRRMTLAEWAAETGISIGTISYRLRRGWPTELVLKAGLTMSECIKIGVKAGHERLRNLM